MDTTDAHPDDATLFDLIEGELDETHARRVETHLDVCTACGALVQAAIDGSPEDVVPVATMAPAQAARLDAAVAGAWRERTAAIIASEAADDARTPEALVADEVALAPLVPGLLDEGAPPELARPRYGARGWRRRVVPVLAFAVLAALAGTSFQIGRDDDARVGSANRDDAQQAESSSSVEAGSMADRSDAEADEFSSGDAGSGDVQTGDVATAEGASPATGGAGATSGSTGEVPSVAPDAAPSAPGAPGAAPASPGDQAKQAGRGGLESIPPTNDDPDGTVDGITDATDAAGEVCIATQDSSQLVLPDGRIPQRVVAGPLGSYVVCG